MYITDAENSAAPIKAVEINTDRIAGALILGKALLFSKDIAPLDSEEFFDIIADGETECYVAGVKAGEWLVQRPDSGTVKVTVNDTEGILRFTTVSGTTLIKPV